jgi:hypothetical protein
MDTYRKTAIIVGVLFITATVTSILSSVFLGSTLAAPISLISVNANEQGNDSIGAALVLSYGFIGIYKLDPNMISSILTILALPIAVQEMIFAVWLIIKGFNPEIINSN